MLILVIFYILFYTIMTMQIKFLGTGAAVATACRDNTSVLTIYKNKKVLLDCPGSAVNKLARLNVDFCKLDAVFISHFHPDHVYGLPALIHSLKPGGNYPKIFVHQKLYPQTLKLLKIFKLDNTAEIIQVNAGRRVEKFNMEFFKTRHTPASLGVKITEKEKSLIYTSDTGPLENGSSIFKGSTALIHDCYALSKYKNEIPGLDSTHSSALKAGETAAAAGVKKLFCVHFSNAVKFSAGALRKEIRKNYSGEIVIPEDLSSYTI